MTFELGGSRERRLWQVSGGALLILFGITLLTLPVWWALWWASVLLVMGRLWWSYLAWPTAVRSCVRFAGGHWWVSNQLAGERCRLPAKPPLILPRVVGLPRLDGRGHYWIYQDQLSTDDWRRLRICARFCAIHLTGP